MLARIILEGLDYNANRKELRFVSRLEFRAICKSLGKIYLQSQLLRDRTSSGFQSREHIF
jgi:hypothetical protein